jgi:hypothetical protein
MEKNVISEDLIKNLLDNVLLEEGAKVNRYEFNRTQFKIEELQNSLNETIKELRKLEDSIPNGLKTLMLGRLTNISQNLYSTQKNISELKEKVRSYKKKLYAQQVEEKKS